MQHRDSFILTVGGRPRWWAPVCSVAGDALFVLTNATIWHFSAFSGLQSAGDAEHQPSARCCPVFIYWHWRPDWHGQTKDHPVVACLYPGAGYIFWPKHFDPKLTDTACAAPKQLTLGWPGINLGRRTVLAERKPVLGQMRKNEDKEEFRRHSSLGGTVSVHLLTFVPVMRRCVNRDRGGTKECGVMSGVFGAGFCFN
jgi:hypothetical protein